MSVQRSSLKEAPLSIKMKLEKKYTFLHVISSSTISPFSGQNALFTQPELLGAFPFEKVTVNVTCFGGCQRSFFTTTPHYEKKV